MGILDLEAAETAAETTSQVKKAIAQGRDRFESRHRRRDGSVFDVEIAVRYQSFDGGQWIVANGKLSASTPSRPCFMPERNGRAPAENLLSRQPDLKVVNRSGYTADIIEDQGMLDDEHHFIQKPYSKGDLAAEEKRTKNGGSPD